MAVDGKVGARLTLLVSVVAAGGLTCLGWAFARLVEPPTWPHLVAVAALSAVAMHCAVELRLRGEPHAFTCASAALLVALAILPGPWAVLCVTAGVLVAEIVPGRSSPKQIVYNTAMSTIGVAAAYWVVTAFGLGASIGGPSSSLPHLVRQIAALAVAAVAYAVVDETLGPAVVACATGLPMRAVFRRDLDIRTGMRVANLVIAGAAAALLEYQVDLVLALPLAIVTVHLTSSQRLRARVERRAGHQLALATTALAAIDPTTDPASVLRRAALAAVRLLSAVEADIVATLDGDRRLVRAGGETVVYDGPALDAPPVPADRDIAVDLGSGRTGELRLRFKGPTSLSEGEQEILRAFAGTVGIALANATTCQDALRMAGARDHDATHDALTGLGNRRAFEQYAVERAARPGLYAVALLDLNHFKQVNDTLGHDAGDLLLIGVARRLADAAEPGDRVIRLGGDEFAVILADLPAPAHALRRGNEILRSLAGSIDVQGIPVTVEAAMGVAAGPVTGGLPELLRRADIAMYQAKRRNQSVVVYRPAAPAPAGPQLGRVRGPERGSRLTYQPIADLGTAQLLAARAVTGWRQTGGLPRQLPTEPAPAYSDDLLGEALRAAASWRTAGFDLPVAVHVPARGLLDPGFVDAVAGWMARTATPFGGLTIELSETLVHSNLDVVRTALRRLVDLGVRLALDEFGATSSPLASLAHAPIHEITVARGLVANLDDPESAAITRSVLDLGRNLDLQVTADGVESETQRVALWELGCTAGRGSLFGQSVTPERLLDVLRGGHDGRPGSVGALLHQPGTVIRLSEERRAAAR